VAPAAPLGNQGTYTITTCDGGSPFDSTIALYANGAAFPLTLIKGDDDAPTGAPGRPDFSSCTPDYSGTTDEDPDNSSITFTATPGVTYKLAVAGAAAAQGGFGVLIFNGYDTLFTDARAGGAPMHAGDTVHSRDVSFSYASVEPNGVSPSHSYQCRLVRDNVAPPALAACPAGAQAYSGLADGAYTFEVADDTDPSPTAFVFTVAGPGPATVNQVLGPGKAVKPGGGQVKLAIAGAKSAGVSRVNKKGVATLKTKIDCRTSNLACAYKTAASGTLRAPSKVRKKKPQKLGGLSATVKAGTEASAKVKLNKTAMSALRSKANKKHALKVKVKISMKAAGAATVNKTVSATLKLAAAGT
jgi:hypothetical protein